MPVGEYYTAEKGGADETVERGQKGKRTEAAQDALVRLGLLEESSGRNKGRDGLFGPKTEAALKKFQRDNDLEATGKLDPDTEAALLDTAPEGDPDDDGDEDEAGSRKPTKASAKAAAKRKAAADRSNAHQAQIDAATAELDGRQKEQAQSALAVVLAMTEEERAAVIARAKKLAGELAAKK